MKSLSKFTLAAVVTACGLVGMHGTAMAETTVNGSMCKPLGDSSKPGLTTYANRVVNTSGGLLQVVCPVVRIVGQNFLTPFVVNVNGYAPPNTSITCTLSSYWSTGILLISTWKSGTGSLNLSLPWQTYGTSQSVVCTLPPNAALFNIDQNE